MPAAKKAAAKRKPAAKPTENAARLGMYRAINTALDAGMTMGEISSFTATYLLEVEDNSRFEWSA
jgi:hypothetical protein